MYIYMYIYICIFVKPSCSPAVRLSTRRSETVRQSPHSVAPVAAAWPLNRLVSLPVARCGSGGRRLDVHPANRIRGL